MDKTHYKELIEKYFEETITDIEIKELSDWIKNDRQLHDWWEQEFERSDSSMNPVLRDKLFARIKEETLGQEEGGEKEGIQRLEQIQEKDESLNKKVRTLSLIHI